MVCYKQQSISVLGTNGTQHRVIMMVHTKAITTRLRCNGKPYAILQYIAHVCAHVHTQQLWNKSKTTLSNTAKTFIVLNHFYSGNKLKWVPSKTKSSKKPTDIL